MSDQDDGRFQNSAMAGGESGLLVPSEPLPPEDSPLPPVSNGGKDPANGRFTVGNRLATGNQVGKKTARFRGRLFHAITNDDFDEMAAQLISKAKQGERWAIQLALAYFCGPPEDVTQDRLVMLERAVLYSGGREDER